MPAEARCDLLAISNPAVPKKMKKARSFLGFLRAWGPGSGVQEDLGFLALEGSGLRDWGCEVKFRGLRVWDWGVGLNAHGFGASSLTPR